LEVIVVDDGSHDGTHERLAPLLDRIVYIYQDNQGVSAARNAGIRAAKGELVAFLDSDDIWHHRKLELQLQYLGDNPETAAVGAASFCDPSRVWPALSEVAGNSARLVRLEDVLLRSPFPTSTFIVRKHCFDALGYFDRGLRNAEDRDLYLRICCRYPLAKLVNVLVWGRSEGEHLSMGSASSEQSTRKMILSVFQRIDALRGRYFLRRQALSYAAYEASYMYLSQGNRLRALHRLMRSFVLWPFPFSRRETSPFKRAKRLIRICLCGNTMWVLGRS
jgi:glycosyltransferase involved in cell wall biosynthesis